jgi:chromosome segregation ATPase
VFDHVRTDLQNQLSDAQVSLQQATATRDAAQSDADLLAGQLQLLQEALTQAQTNAQNANSALASAQAIVEQRQQTCVSAQSARDAAQNNLSEYKDREPENPLPNGHPNPAWLAWKKEVQRLETVLAAAQSALDTANAALAQAQQGPDAAASAAAAARAAVTTAQNQLSSVTTGVATAQQRVAAASAALNDAQRIAALLSAQISGLDARAARILAGPLDRADLEQAADAELADLLDHRHHRHDLLTHRVDLVTDRATVLVAQDATVDGVGTLRAAIGAWTDTGRYSTLAGVAAALDAIVIASQTQRAQPAAQRTDDLPRTRTILATQLDSLQAALRQASAERETANATLAQAIQAINDLEQAQP